MTQNGIDAYLMIIETFKYKMTFSGI